MQSVKLQPQSTSTKRSKKKLPVIGGQSKSVRNERVKISAHYKDNDKAQARWLESECELADWLATEAGENQPDPRIQTKSVS